MGEIPLPCVGAALLEYNNHYSTISCEWFIVTKIYNCIVYLNIFLSYYYIILLSCYPEKGRGHVIVIYEFYESTLKVEANKSRCEKT